MFVDISFLQYEGQYGNKKTRTTNNYNLPPLTVRYLFLEQRLFKCCFLKIIDNSSIQTCEHPKYHLHTLAIGQTAPLVSVFNYLSYS